MKDKPITSPIPDSSSETPVRLGEFEALRLHVLERLALLCQKQQYSKNYFLKFHRLLADEHHKVLKALAQIREAGGIGHDADQVLEDVFHRCERLQQTSDCFLQAQKGQWERGGYVATELLRDFNDTSGELTTTLIEKDLFDRQSRVLEKIILSHEHVADWKGFVQQILRDFHSMFPFNFFVIAFSEENSLSLFVYYMGVCPDAVKDRVRHQLTRRVMSSLGLEADTSLDSEEFQVLQTAMEVNEEDVAMIVAKVPEHTPKLAGMLGVAYALSKTLTSQEAAIIRSILAVMVMVVGSSKVLSRTLSELEYYSVHDPLTGLHNRRYFNDMLEYEFSRSERYGRTFSIVSVDCDNFKEINDSYGHPCGDDVLVQLSEIMRGVMRKGDLVARLGGDEFALLLPETGEQGAVQAAEHLRKQIHNAVFNAPDGSAFHTTISAGTATYPKNVHNKADLMAACDVAMYQAKELGKDDVRTFKGSERLEQTRSRQAAIEELRQALDQAHIVPWFQPIVDCKTGETFAYEVLARRLEEGKDATPAAAFIEDIENYGLARELDRAIIIGAFAAMQQRMQQGKPVKPMFINLSVHEIQGRNVLGFAEKLCAEMGIPPAMVVFELLERQAIGDMTGMRRFLVQLRRKGFRFALDDFGSGYNSFHYLRELHFDFVKIDGPFVRAIPDSTTDEALVRNLSRLCQDLGILTIAEFVENEDINQRVKQMGINYAQGYHLGMPSAGMH